MNNEKLAKAIVALYAVIAQSGRDDADDELLETCFSLYEKKVDIYPIEFSALLYKSGMPLDDVCDFCEVTEREILYAGAKPF